LKLKDYFKNNKMRKITGTVTCNNPNAKLEPGCVAQIQVNDVSIACGRAKTLGSAQIDNPDKFPFKFQVEYDDEPIKKLFHGQYAISVRIERMGKLEFINDTRFNINDIEKNIILDHIDVFVISVN
jgi:uncharacterized lipoprotein YbaY